MFIESKNDSFPFQFYCISLNLACQLGFIYNNFLVSHQFMSISTAVFMNEQWSWSRHPFTLLFVCFPTRVFYFSSYVFSFRHSDLLSCLCDYLSNKEWYTFLHEFRSSLWIPTSVKCDISIPTSVKCDILIPASANLSFLASVVWWLEKEH